MQYIDMYAQPVTSWDLTRHWCLSIPYLAKVVLHALVWLLGQLCKHYQSAAQLNACYLEHTREIEITRLPPPVAEAIEDSL